MQQGRTLLLVTALGCLSLPAQRPQVLLERLTPQEKAGQLPRLWAALMTCSLMAKY